MQAQASTSSTWRSATCSEPGVRASARSWRGALALLLALAAGAGGAARARVFATQEEALARLMPPPIRVERRTAYLDEAGARRVEALCGAPLDHQVVPYYVGLKDGAVVGYAFTDTHIVRTLAESVLFALQADGRIRSADILTFDEPPDYQPGERWLAQFGDRGLDDSLSLKRDIRALSGATLSSRAVTAAARRVLALFQVIVRDPQEAAPGPGAGSAPPAAPAPGARSPEGRP